MAVNWNDYQPTDWSPGMPITEGRMDHLEQGVTDNRNDVQELNDILNGTEGLVNKVNTITSGIGTNAVSDYANKTLWQAIASLYNATNIEGQTQKINQGAEAYAQIVSAVGGYDELGNLKKSLSQRLEGIEQQEANDISGILDAFGRANNIPVFDSTNTVSKTITDLKNILGKNADNTAYYFDDNQNTVAIKMRDLIRRMGDAETELFSNSISGTTYASLSDRLTGITNSLQALGGTNGAVPLVQQELSNAHESSVITVDQGGTQVNKTYDSIDARFEDIESRAETLKDTVGEKINVSAIRNALNVTETGTVLDGRVGKTIRDMLYNTATETAFTASDTVAGRIAAAVSDISTLQGAVGETALVSNVVKEEVEGQEVNKQYDDIGERFTDIETHAADMQNNLNDINAELEAAHESSVIKDQVEDEETHEITEVNKQYDSIDSRFEAIETHKKAIADEIEAARTSTVVRTEVPAAEEGEDPTYTDTTYNSLDARLEAIENHAASVRFDVNTIANELAMVDDVTHNIKDTNTKIDDLTSDVQALATEISMGHDEFGRLTGAETRIDDIELVIDHVQGENDEIPNGLTQRIEALETTVDTAETGLSARMTAAETVTAMVTNQTTGLAATKAIADANALAINGQGGLDERISALEDNPVSATEVITEDYIEYDSEGNPTIYTTNGENTHIDDNKAEISSDKDYLLEKDHKYYYWKWIDMGNGTHKWALISSGGSGTGNTSGMDLTAEQYATIKTNHAYAENTDYYVLEADGARHHYRYITIDNILTEIEIGPILSNIKTYNISSGVQTVKIDNVDTDVTYLYLHEFAYGEDNSEPNENTIITRIPLPAGGGVISTQKMVRITERNVIQPLGANTAVELKFFYTSGVAKESGIGELYIDDVLIRDNIAIISGDPKDASSTWPTVTQENPLPDGFYSIDISEYCTELGTQQFRIKISDPDDTTGTMWKDLKWDVNVMNLTISSEFTEHSINTLNSTVRFTYTANGDIDKIANFKLGDIVLPTVSLGRNTSGQLQEYILSMPQAGAGAYRLEAWLTATANGHTLPPSKTITRDIIWYDPASSNVIISSKYRNNINEPITQYETLEIPYTITGGTTPYKVYYYVDDMDNPINEVQLTGNSGVWEYNALTKGTHNLKITCQSQSITFSLKVAEQKIDIAPVTTGLVLDFNPQGITNTSTKRLWTNNVYSMSVTDNFDWYNGGYGSDEEGDYFLIKAGTRAIFDYKMFRQAQVDNSIVNEVFETGKELKVIFKTSAVRNADAVWFTNMGPSSASENAKQVGIQLNAHNGFLKTNAASDTAVGSGDDEVAATNTYLYFSYSEEDKIELDININQKSDTSQFIMSYEDGCPSKAYPYKTSEILYHIEDETHTPSDIIIGSDDCDVYIYRMRIYDMELNTEQVLRNFIADGKDSNECIKRYNRNCIYYDTKEKEFIPYSNNNTILDPERLAMKIPDIKVLMLETPQFTKDKKDFIPYSSLRCIHAPGGKYFKSRGKLDNWKFINGYHVGQGTTSDKYGNAGRNLDFLFMCDGIHNPSDKVSVKKENFLPGYQSALILGYGTDEQEAPTYCLDWKDEDTWAANKEYGLTDNGHDTLVRYNGEVYKCIEAHTSTSTFDTEKWQLQKNYTSKITLKSDSIPNNFFNLKVNIASSENANNALLQKRYNDFLPYVSPAKARDNRIKNDMEFVPAIIFVKETGSAVVDGQTITYQRREFNDSEWHFYALGNIGDSKKTDYTRAYDPDDMNEFTLEISDNNTNNSQFQSGVYMASFYKEVENPIIDNIGEYYSAGKIIEAVEFNNETQYYGDFTKTLDEEINNEHTYYEFVEKRRSIEPYTLEQDMDDGEPVEGSFTARSAAGEGIQEVDYLFPINYDTEWAAVDSEGRPLNMRYWALSNEGFDGDHSFEMRYACKGDYRDGKVVNDTTGRAKAQLKINEKVWREFYTWLITSTNEQFVNELDQWCVKASVDFFYAFTHYYTMMDNRAKNTFWHFAKTGKHRKVTRPVKALLHIYEEANGNVNPSIGDPNIFEGNFIPTSDTAITLPFFVDEYTLVTASKFSSNVTYYTYNNNQYSIAEVTAGNDVPETTAYYTHAYVLTNDTIVQNDTVYYQLINNVYTPAEVTVGAPIKQYYTQYAFDMWVYDTDTALGIDNNGELVFPYGKEDSDYRIENDPSSSNVFNGAGSVFWRRLRDNCKDDIRSIFTSVRSECFNAETLIEEFDKWQECYPEAIWRLDVERKYIRSFTGDTGPNNSYITHKETRFLRDMMQGRKKYQRRQWVKDQDIYFGSKYMLPSVSSDFFEFSCYNPGGQAVIPNWDLTITPYQDMYINISYAETFASPFRAKAGQPYEFKSILNTMNDSRIRVFGANHIQALEGQAKREDPNDPEKITGADGLASFYIKANNFEHGKKLRKLILGTDNPAYQNGNFTTLNIANDYPILEEFSIKNCNNLGGELDFSKSTALRRIEAQGTKITQVLLPGSTGIQILHLPDTITKVGLKSAKQLTEITINNRAGQQNLSNLTQLDINDSDYNSSINWMTIANSALSHLDLLSLLNLQTSSIGNISELEIFSERKKQINNRVQLSGYLTVTGAWSTVQRDTYGGKSTSVWPELNFNLIGEEKKLTKVTYMNRAYNQDGVEVSESIIEVRYISADGSLTERVIPDIYKNTSINNLPKRDPTIDSIYQFGIIEDNEYLMYSGWTLSRQGSSATALSEQYNERSPYRATTTTPEVTLYTFFNSTKHQYTVNWYSEPDTLVKYAVDQDFGGGYGLEAPTIKYLRDNNFKTVEVNPNSDGTVQCKYFKGWQKLPTNISPSIEEAQTSQYNIYGDWYDETKPLSGENGWFYDVSNPTLEQLLVLSRLENTQRNEFPDTSNLAPLLEYNYRMGYEGQKEGTIITNTTRRFNDRSPVSGEQVLIDDQPIMPFKTNQGFTLAIDYMFDPNQTQIGSAAILVGCYSKNDGNVTGFALYDNYNTNQGAASVRVGYGDMFSTDTTKSFAVGVRGERNIVVLRHPKNSSQLYIYSGTSYNDSTLPTAVQIYGPIEVNTQVSTEDAVLCLGHLRTDLNPESDEYNSNYAKEAQNLIGAYGTIYWAKYWDEDLGMGECRQLAAWPHEYMTAKIAAIDNNSTSNNTTRPSIYLSNLNTTSHGRALLSKFESSKGTQGWNNSKLKEICNSRIFLGLPAELQSSLGNPLIGYRNYTPTRDQFGTVGSELSTVESANAFIYLPSISSLNDNLSTYNAESILERMGSAILYTESDITPYSWNNDYDAMVVYNYDPTNQNAVNGWIQVSGDSRYFNLRFANKPIKWSSSNPMRIFTIASSQLNNRSFRDLIGASNLRENDIVILTNALNSEYAYMYVTSNTYNNLGLERKPAANSTTDQFYTQGQGGWIQSTGYFTRSVTASAYNNSNFIYITPQGNVILPSDNGTASPSALSFNFAFTI